MNNLDSLYQRCSLLGTFRGSCLHFVFQAYYDPQGRDAQKNVQAFSDHLDGILNVAASLGLNLDRRDLFKDFKKIDKFATFFVDLGLVRDSVGKSIKETYGKKYFFTYFIAQMLVIIRPLSSLTSKVAAFETIPKHRQKIVREEIGIAEDYIVECQKYLNRHLTLIRELFGEKFFQGIKKLIAVSKNRKDTAVWANKIHFETEFLVNSLVPHYDDISERLEISKLLQKELKKCRPGLSNWRNYELICVKILRFLFIPPFKEVKLQARSKGNKEQRDAILPNNQYSGFWKLIHDEFNSRHIVCEFKNGNTHGDKQWLNQLRIYLSKPTIGKFGLLITRNKCSKSLIQAQRDAYEQSGILVLVIDDTRLKELMMARVFIGCADSILERYKTEFEIQY